MTLTQPRGLTLSLGALAALLAAAAIWPWLGIGSRPPQTVTTATAPALMEVPPLPPVASFSQTVERPLFAPGRRRTGTGPAAGPTLLESRYRLLGTIVVGDERRAVLGDTIGRRTVEMAEGGVLDGWTLKRIEVQSVTFDGPAGLTTLTLPSAGAAPPAR